MWFQSDTVVSKGGCPVAPPTAECQLSQLAGARRDRSTLSVLPANLLFQCASVKSVVLLCVRPLMKAGLINEVTTLELYS